MLENQARAFEPREPKISTPIVMISEPIGHLSRGGAAAAVAGGVGVEVALIQDTERVPMVQWTSTTLVKWLSQYVEISPFSQLFIQNGVDGKKFICLSETILKSMCTEPMTIGTRKKIFAARARYLESHVPPLPTSPPISSGGPHPPPSTTCCAGTPINKWTSRDLHDVLCEIGLSHRADLFLNENIDGIEFQNLTENEFLEIFKICCFEEKSKIQKIKEQFCFPQSKPQQTRQGPQGSPTPYHFFLSETPIPRWSTQDVKDAFLFFGLTDFIEKIVNQEIDGSILISLTKTELRDDFQLFRYGDLKKLDRLLQIGS